MYSYFVQIKKKILKVKKSRLLSLRITRGTEIRHFFPINTFYVTFEFKYRVEDEFAHLSWISFIILDCSRRAKKLYVKFNLKPTVTEQGFFCFLILGLEREIKIAVQSERRRDVFSRRMAVTDI